MAAPDHDGQYFTHDARLASFQKSSRKRGSAAAGRGRALNWPHKQIAPSSLARAGFYFSPLPGSPDNVVCFLCQKALDGWESGDDPLLEHLKHAPHCGWAVVAAIEADVGNYGKEDPGQPLMLESRKATFAGRWPHEGKKGWKCKVKQLVDAGWKYTPTADSDDMATCTYCQLALDGWEPSDKPFDEHYKRSPDCAFFSLMAQFGGNKRKNVRGKADRASKASRASTQSAAAAAVSDTLLTADVTSDVEDSNMTTSSTTMTQPGTRRAKAKKNAPGKGRKSKVKPKEAKVTRVLENEVHDPVASLPPPARATRGRKRGSDAMDISNASIAESSAPKRRATRSRKSAATTATEFSTIMPDDDEIPDASLNPKAPGRKKGRPSNARSAKKIVPSFSNASVASLRSKIEASPGEKEDIFPDDDEIERQLEAELERDYSSDGEIGRDTILGRLQSDSRKSEEKADRPKSMDYAMFDPAPAEADDAAIEKELQGLQLNMADEAEEQLQVPKKKRKTGTRKASKQTRSRKTKARPQPPTPEPAEDRASNPETPEAANAVEEASHLIAENPSPGQSKRTLSPLSASSATEFTQNFQQDSSAMRTSPPSTALLPSPSAVDDMELVMSAEPEKTTTGQSRLSGLSRTRRSSREVHKAESAEETRQEGDLQRPSSERKPLTEALEESRPAFSVADANELEKVQEDVVLTEAVVAEDEEGQENMMETGSQGSPLRSETASRQLGQPPSTPPKAVSQSPSAGRKQPSPSLSPQASDAENQPPSMGPTASTSTRRRVVLAPVAVTPSRASPSKRNVLMGLESTVPWVPSQLDAVLGSPGDKENAMGHLLRQGKGLTSPEKRMTVEEWIYFNAAEAEKKLKHDCETMVSQFEREGTRAMRVLEGLSVE